MSAVSFTQWIDKRLTPKVVARILNNHLSSLYRVVVSNYTERLGGCEWELRMATGVFTSGQDDRLGIIWVREIRSKTLDKEAKASGINYGYSMPAPLPDEWDKELLTDIFVRGKKYVDEHFGFGRDTYCGDGKRKVSKEKPWDFVNSHQQARILRHWHPDGGHKKAGEVVAILFGEKCRNRHGRSKYITNQISLMRKEYGADIVPYRNEAMTPNNRRCGSMLNNDK